MWNVSNMFLLLTSLLLSDLPFFESALINQENNACYSLEAYPLSLLPLSGCYYDPNVDLDIPSMAELAGYQAETHEVTTDDGYILTMFRIYQAGKPPGKPVFFQHGIGMSAASWVDKGNNRSLGLLVAAQSYDVWLGNFRGTTYSYGHVNLTKDDPKYWDFNLDIVAENDLGTQLQYVATKTQPAGKIIYIGYSKGGTTIFMYGSKYSEKTRQFLKGVITLAPAVYLHNTIILDQYATALPILDVLINAQIKGIFYQEELTHPLKRILCRFLPRVCLGTLDALFGKPHEFDPTDLLKVFSRTPSGIALREFRQYFQFAASKTFEMYDYGTEKNQQLYKSPTPPDYNLGSFDLPVHIIGGETDSIAGVPNYPRILNELGSSNKVLSMIGEGNFNHANFMYAKDVECILYDQVLQIVDEFDKLS